MCIFFRFDDDGMGKVVQYFTQFIFNSLRSINHSLNAIAITRTLFTLENLQRLKGLISIFYKLLYDTTISFFTKPICTINHIFFRALFYIVPFEITDITLRDQYLGLTSGVDKSSTFCCYVDVSSVN